MSTSPPFDVNLAHHFFSTKCFNRAWELIEKSDRTPAEDEEMIQLSIASLWHWGQRPDCTDKNLSISCWQVSRVYALTGHADEARQYAQRSLQAAERGELYPYYFAYAYEALARAESIAGRREEASHALAEAHRYAEQTPDDEHRVALLADLNTILV